MKAGLNLEIFPGSGIIRVNLWPQHSSSWGYIVHVISERKEIQKDPGHATFMY